MLPDWTRSGHPVQRCDSTRAGRPHVRRLPRVPSAGVLLRTASRRGAAILSLLRDVVSRLGARKRCHFRPFLFVRLMCRPGSMGRGANTAAAAARQRPHAYTTTAVYTHVYGCARVVYDEHSRPSQLTISFRR